MMSVKGGCTGRHATIDTIRNGRNKGKDTDKVKEVAPHHSVGKLKFVFDSKKSEKKTHEEGMHINMREDVHKVIMKIKGRHDTSRHPTNAPTAKAETAQHPGRSEQTYPHSSSA